MTSQVTTVLAAADHIEQNPECYNFLESVKPETLDSEGCALGWIGFFMGLAPVDPSNYPEEVAKALGFGSRFAADIEFYRDMDELHDPAGVTESLRHLVTQSPIADHPCNDDHDGPCYS